MNADETLGLEVAPEWRGDRTRHDKTIILSSPRSGSNHLVSLLGSAAAMFCFGELFDMDKPVVGATFRRFYSKFDAAALERARRLDPARFLKAIWGSGTRPTTQCIGFKLHYHQYAGASGESFLSLLNSQPDVRVIHLFRGNLLAQYVSLELAMITGVWLREKAAPVAANGPPATVTVSPEAFARYVGKIRRMRAETLGGLSSLETIHVAYENLIADPAASLAAIGAHIGVDLDGAKSWFDKQRTAPLSEVVANWSELERHFAGTDLAPFFDGNAP